MATSRLEDIVKPTRLRDDEIWNLRTSLPALIADSVRRLAEMDHGHPMGLTGDQWKAVLVGTAQAFETVAEDDCENFDEIQVALFRGLALLGEWWFDLWD